MSDQEHLSKAEFLAHIEPMRKDITEIVSLQREQNGRQAKADTRIAILEDRSPGRVSATVSAVVSGIVSGLAIYFGSQKGQ